MINRKYKISKYLDNSQSILILGARGSGKSYFLRHLIKSKEHSYYIDLLDSSLFRKYKTNPNLLYLEIKNKLLNINSLFVVVDEIQLVPELLNEVHRAIEDFEKKAIFILTGSSARKLKKTGVNLLAGRALKLDFYPFSILEIDFQNNLEKIIKYGLLPNSYVQTDHEIIFQYLNTYAGLYLQEEVANEGYTRNISSFSRFLELSSQLNGTIINYSKLARTLGVASSTIKDYYLILKDTLIANEIPAWTQSIKKQLVLASKYYYFDNGILNALQGNLSLNINKSTSLYGTLFENLIVNEIIKLNSIQNLNYSIYHYKTNSGIEIDLILQRKGEEPLAIEIKSGDNIDEEDLKHLKSFRKEFPNSNLIVLSNVINSYEIDNIKILNFSEGLRLLSNKLL